MARTRFCTCPSPPPREARSIAAWAVALPASASSRGSVPMWVRAEKAATVLFVFRALRKLIDRVNSSRPIATLPRGKTLVGPVVPDFLDEPGERPDAFDDHRD